MLFNLFNMTASQLKKIQHQSKLRHCKPGKVVPMIPKEKNNNHKIDWERVERFAKSWV
jgi:hypothetical protein